MLSVGSLFSGIGGFDLGLERAGMRTVWFCENDEFCQRVLAKHWPSVPCHPDITQLVDPEPVDVLCGGFPCQDLSWAGAGEGIGGTRSGLWSEYARLIGELRPRYVVVENVAALLARGMGVVLGDLAAIGYDAEWDCLPASAFGAPHRRDRIWIVAYPDDEAQHALAVDAEVGSAPQLVADASRNAEGRVRPAPGAERERAWPSRQQVAAADAERSGLEGHGPVAGQQEVAELGDGGALADADERRRDGRSGAFGEADGRRQPADSGWWLTEPDVGRVAHGVPARVDRLRSLGNALVPQIAEWIGRRIVSYEEGRDGQPHE